MTDGAPTAGDRVLIVSPTYCEADNVGEFLSRVRPQLPRADILVVDDASPDGTAALVEGLAGQLGQISVLHRPGKGGLGAAYRAGFAQGLSEGYDILVEMDADLSHDPAMLASLVDAAAGGVDLVIGSRYVDGGSTPNWPLVRRVISRVGCRYASFALNIPVRDATAGFRAYRAPALRAVDSEHTLANGYAFQIELAYRLVQRGATIQEMPIVFRDRQRGVSKMSLWIAVEAMLLVTRWGIADLFRGRRYRRGAGIGDT
jgi:dolichol-phosphate mannosyltransferase